MSKKQGFLRTLYRTLREAEWLISLSSVIGIPGWIGSVLGGGVVGIIARAEGIPWSIGIFLALGTATFITVLVVVIKASRLEESPDSKSLTPPKTDGEPKIIGAPPETQYLMILSQHFENRAVLLDGHHFVNCTFKDCALQYNGGRYRATIARSIRELGQ